MFQSVNVTFLKKMKHRGSFRNVQKKEWGSDTKMNESQNEFRMVCGNRVQIIVELLMIWEVRYSFHF